MRERGLELLAPAGDESALIAAVQSGADAVYLGTGAFNARRNARNFDGDALDRAVEYCHIRGVKVHVTLNTLVTQDELPALEDAVRRIFLSGADAVIVQDFGVARAVREMAPGIALHASTQMAVHNRQGAAFLREQGFDRAVLARELTYAEVAECAREGIEIETFVHGALCTACSGQCLMSSLVGGRSGNRGLCAQPCRLPWRLEGREGCLLSTKDLCAIGDLARLRDAGVRSLKIEGRMKRAEYVAVTVAAYRRALDALAEGRRIDLEAERADLAQMFNRGGFTRGYGPGVEESDLLYPERPNHIGVQVGRCRRSGAVALEADVEGADALALRRSGAEDIPVKLEGRAGESAGCPAARQGDRLYRLVSAAQMRAARDCLSRERRRIPLDVKATLRVGERPRIEVSDGGRAWSATLPEPIERATGRPFDRERARAQLTKTGNTPFVVRTLEIEADDDAFCSVSTLNGLRRAALSPDGSARAARAESLREIALPTPGGAAFTTGPRPLLMAQSGDVAALCRALAQGADIAVFAPRDVRREALEAVDLSPLGDRLALALPAVLTAEALESLNAWARTQPFRMTYLSNIGQFGMTWPGEAAGDYLLNVGNGLSVAQLADWGMDACTPSLELTAGQIRAMGGRAGLILWGRIPLMHLRHCPLRAARGMKGRHADCRHCDVCAPGERLEGRALVDRRGASFPLRRLAMPGGCAVQVLNSAVLMPLRRLDRLPRAESWRLLLDDGDDVGAVVRIYRAALDGADFKSLPEWGVIDAGNTTTGHYFRGVE